MDSQEKQIQLETLQNQRMALLDQIKKIETSMDQILHTPCETDITDHCRLEFRNSGSSNGKYIAVIYHSDPVCARSKVVAVIGVKAIPIRGYAIRLAQGATVSFKVYRLN